jgi:hypothetical protein
VWIVDGLEVTIAGAIGAILGMAILFGYATLLSTFSASRPPTRRTRSRLPSETCSGRSRSDRCSIRSGSRCSMRTRDRRHHRSAAVQAADSDRQEIGRVLRVVGRRDPDDRRRPA